MRLGIAFQFRQLTPVCNVGLGRGENHRFGFEACTEAFQLANDHFEVFDRIWASVGIRYVDQMDQYPGALDVTQKLSAEAGTLVCAFDEAGNVGYHKAHFMRWIANCDDSEIGLERGKRII